MITRGQKVLNLVLNSNLPNEASTSHRALGTMRFWNVLREQPIAQVTDSDDAVRDNNNIPNIEEAFFSESGEILDNNIGNSNENILDTEAIAQVTDSDDSVRDNDYITDIEEMKNLSSESDEILDNNIGNVNEDIPDTEAIENNISSERKTPKRRRPKSWKKKVRKMDKNSGNPHINSKGNNVPGKAIGDPCNDRWRLKCNAVLPDINDQEDHDFFEN